MRRQNPDCLSKSGLPFFSDQRILHFKPDHMMLWELNVYIPSVFISRRSPSNKMLCGGALGR